MNVVNQCAKSDNKWNANIYSYFAALVDSNALANCAESQELICENLKHYNDFQNSLNNELSKI